ncbi:MAG TPA: MoaD family protein [Verrucomicrobiae bacterium]|nr:MoaD family protein [Verrucomicrobiae bacterium]
MPKTIHIPTPLQKLCDNQGRLETSGETVGAALDEIYLHYPFMQDRITDANGEIRKSLNIYVNEENIRFLENLGTPLKEGDEVTILPAISGG